MLTLNFRWYSDCLYYHTFLGYYLENLNYGFLGIFCLRYIYLVIHRMLVPLLHHHYLLFLCCALFLNVHYYIIYSVSFRFFYVLSRLFIYHVCPFVLLEKCSREVLAIFFVLYIMYCFYLCFFQYLTHHNIFCRLIRLRYLLSGDLRDSMSIPVSSLIIKSHLLTMTL